MKKRASFLKKCMAVCLCVSLLSSFGSMILSANAEESSASLLDGSKVTNWWNWNWNLTETDTARFSATYAEDGSATVKFKGDFRDLTHLGTQISADLTQTPYFTCNISSDFKYNLYLLVSDSSEGNNGVLIESAVPAGTHIKGYDVLSVLSSYVKDNSISLYGFKAVPTENVNGKSITFNKLEFTKEKPAADTKISLLTGSKVTNWWNWNWNLTPTDSSRFSVTYGSDGSAEVNFKGDFRDLTHLGTQISADLTQTPYFTCNISSDFKYNLYLLVSGSSEGNGGVLIESAVPAGTHIKGYDIASVLSSYVKDNSISLYGFKAVPTENVNGKKISFNSLEFTKEKPEVELKPSLLTGSKLTNWWNWNWNLSASDSSRFSVTYGSDGSAEVNFKGDFRDLTHIGTSVTADLNATPYFSCDITSDIRYNLYLLVSGSSEGNGGVLIESSVPAGTHKKVYDVKNLLSSYVKNDSISLYGFKAVPTEDTTNKKIKFNTLEFTETKPIEPDPTESWIINQNPSNWWNWDWCLGVGTPPERFSVSQETSGKITVVFKGDFRSLTYIGDNIDLNLEDTPYFYCDFVSGVPCKLYLMVSGSSEGNNGILIKDNIPAGRFNAKMKISDILPGYIKNNSISLYGFVLVPTDETTAKKIEFSAMDFGADGKDFSSARPIPPTVSINTSKPAESVTVSLKAPSDAKKVQYRYGIAGAWKEYTEPFILKKNVVVYSRYVSAGNMWSALGSLAITNIKQAYNEDVKPVVPIWFNKGEEDNCWYNWNWRHGTGNPEDPNNPIRFTITYPDNIWSANVALKWVTRLETQHNNEKYHVTVDLDEQNAVFYKIDTQFNCSVRLKIKTDSGYTAVKIGEVSSGKSSGSFFIGDNAELLALSDDENRLPVTGLIFDSFETENQNIKVERFLFDTEDNYYPGYPGESVDVKEVATDWFSLPEIGNWTTEDNKVNISDVGGEVKINTDNDWEYLVTNPQKANEVTSGGTTVSAHLEAANTLYYMISTDFDVKVQLGIKNKGNITYVDAVNLKSGESASSVNLNTIPGIEDFSVGGSLKIASVRFVPQNAKAGQSLVTDLFVFNGPDAVYEGYPDNEQINADKKAAAYVDSLIDAIGTVTLESKASIEKARREYDALTENQRYYVTKYSQLVLAENEYYALYLESPGAVADIFSDEYLIDYMTYHPGELIKLRTEKAPVLSAALIAAAKNNDCDIMAEILSKKDGSMIYSLHIKNEDMTDTLSPFDTAVYKKTSDNSEFETKLGKESTVFELNPNNRLKAVMNVNLTSADALFKTDSEAAAYIIKSGNLTQLTNGKESLKFYVSSGAKYVISSKTSVVAENITLGENTSTESGGIFPGNDITTGTGDNSRTAIFIVLQVISLISAAVFAIAAYRNRKKGNEYENI